MMHRTARPHLLIGYIENEMPAKAIEIFKRVEDPNEIVLTLMFKACAQLSTDWALELVKSAVSKMPVLLYKSAFLMTSLLDALMQCKDVNSARSLFDASERKVISMYGAMMKGNFLNFIRDKVPILFFLRRLCSQRSAC